MSLLRRLFFCTFGYHIRSQQRAKYIDNHLVSECKYCRIEMYKDLRQNRWLIGTPE